MDYKKAVKQAVQKKSASGLISALKDASDSEEDLSLLIAESRDGAASLLFKALSEEGLHDRAVIILSKVCSGDNDTLLKLCALLNSSEDELVSGAAAVLTSMCPRNVKTCASLPDWVVGRLLEILKSKPKREAFADRRRWSRVRATEALGAIGSVKAVPDLAKALGDADAMIVLRARYALVRVQDQEEVVRELKKLIEKEGRIVPLVGALWVLERVVLSMPHGKESEASTLIPALSGLLARNDDTEIQLKAVKAMVKIDREEGVKEIARLLETHHGARTERVWRVAVSSLSRLAESDYPNARKLLREFVEKEGGKPEDSRASVYPEAVFALEVLEAGDENR